MKIDIDCIILAAGISSRMSKWKMLLPYNGTTIIENSVENALAVCNNIILVVGYRSTELKKIFMNRENITIIENYDYKKGMFSSVQIGVSAVTTDYFFISLGDLPLVSSNIYKILAEYKGTKAVFPVNDKKRGHPVLLPKSIIKQILEEEDNTSMKKLLITYPTTLVPVDTESIYRDIDTKEDYIRLQHFITK